MIFGNKGLLGINARNLLYIRPYNKKKAIKLADDKIKTKQFLSAREIPVPRLYGIIRKPEEVEKYDLNTLPSSFVIKPNNGYGGEGIIPIITKREGYYISAGGKKLTKGEIYDHIRDILDGRFSISNIGDSAFFEQYIVADDKLGKFSYEGLPDIRVIVHNLIPVMAMLRLPTKESNGKANLHLGAVGVGIDIARGEATNIAYKNKIIETLPDGLGKIRGEKIPFWNEILVIASKAQLITNLGFMAIDISIDKTTGPVVLEINARAGLGVQIANLAPLRKRLERIEGIKVTTPQKGVRIAKDMFGNIVEKEIAHLSGKDVIGAEEEVEIIHKNGGIRLLAQVDTSNKRSILDEYTAEKAGLLDDTEAYDDEKSTLKVKFSLKKQRIQTILDIENIPSEKYKMILGIRDLSNFLIDPAINSQKKEEKKQQTKDPKDKKAITKTNYHQIDQKLTQVDGKIKLLYHLRPTNLEAERDKFMKNKDYNPQFEYPKLKFDSLELIDELEKIETDETPLGVLFDEKRDEIENKIALLESIDEPSFTDISIRLFEKPTEEEVLECKTILNDLDLKNQTKEEKLYSAEEAKIAFEKIFKKYELRNWKVKLKKQMVADCVAGKNNCLFIQEDAKFSRERIESLIVHEIETHILTAENGKMQPYDIFNRGLSNYLTTQEGLAMYNVEKQRHIPFEKNHRALAHVVAIHIAMNGSFSDIFKELTKLGVSEKQAFRSALKSKRGFSDTSQKGAFTKDYIYFKGYKQIKDFVESGGNLKDLYVGKLDIKDIETIKLVPGIILPKILPDWLPNK